jgi:hypothetical protein
MTYQISLPGPGQLSFLFLESIDLFLDIGSLRPVFLCQLIMAPRF